MAGSELRTRVPWGLLNPERATQEEAETGTSNDKFITPLSSKQAVDYGLNNYIVERWGRFENSSETSGIQALTYSDELSKFAAINGDGKALISPNGYEWTYSSGIAVGGRAITFLDSGVDLFISGFNNGEIYSSPDGFVWTLRQTLPGAVNVNRLAAVNFIIGNDQVIAVGNNGIIDRSTNGVTWGLSVGDPGFGVNGIEGVDAAFNRVIVCGVNGIMSFTDDFINWAYVLDSSFGISAILNIIYVSALSRWVAVGADGKIGYSDDNGITWLQATSPFGTSTIFDIVWSDKFGMFLAVGVSGKAAWSLNGENWTLLSDVKLTGDILSATTAPFIDRFVIGAVGGKTAYTL
jgi:photosystem II stability/assembly factor-like uncharacterized protein